MTKTDLKLKKIKIKAINKTYVLFSLYILAYLGLSFMFANMLSDKGKVIRDLENTKNQLLVEHKDLLTEKNDIASLGYIKEKATELGYISSDYNFIKDSDSLALR